MACVLSYKKEKQNLYIVKHRIFWTFPDRREYKKNFPKLTPQSLWDTFTIVQSPILSEMGVSAGFSEYEKHEIWGIFTA